MNYEVLPIGTVVKVKEKKYMIVGYNVVSDGVLYDYVAFPFPMGLEDVKGDVFFNQKVIEEVIYQGYIFKNYDLVNKNITNQKKEIASKLGGGE